jgi:hypothetical protein
LVDFRRWKACTANALPVGARSNEDGRSARRDEDAATASLLRLLIVPATTVLPLSQQLRVLVDVGKRVPQTRFPLGRGQTKMAADRLLPERSATALPAFAP